MAQYALLRLVQMVPVLFFITLIVFVVNAMIPGDPTTSILGADATPAQVATLRGQMGLDQPIFVQYGIWVSGVVRGDLGRSYLSKRPVDQLVGNALPISAELAVLATIVGLLIAVPIGIVSAVKRGSGIDLIATVGAYAGLSLPSFWLAIMLIYLFALLLRWLPASGYIPFTEDPVGHVKSMLLPTIALGVLITAQLMRYLRSGVLDVLGETYVTTARSKGLRERVVIVRHAVRNALIPFVTVLGLQLARLLGGTVIVERVFAIPGIGQLAINAISTRDYPVVQGVVLLTAATFVLINLLVDLLYGVLDPRISVGGGTS